MAPLKKYLLLNTFLLFLLVTLVNTYNCPDYCNCSIINNGNKTIHYTKCTNLDGLRKIDKNLPIEYLDLSNIGLTKITTQIRLLKNLTNINLSNNLLSDVSKLGTGIKTLDLSHNYFTSGKLSKIPTSVVNLNLSYNEITYLPIGLKNLRLLKTLELVGNPINCTCETLMVRNWLQEKYVWTDEHIKCSLPLRFKGRPWLQVKQSDVCEQRSLKSRASSYNWDDDDDDNDLMLGDQPVFEDGSGEVEPDNSDELNRDFLLVSGKSKNKNFTPVDNITYDEGDGDGSGGGILKDPSLDLNTLLEDDNENESSGDTVLGRKLTDDDQNNTASTDVEDDDDGSGSGGGILIIPPIIIDDDDSTTKPTGDVGYDEGDDDAQNEYVSPLTPGLGIFGNGLTESTEHTPEPQVVEEEAIDKSRVLVHAAPPTASPNDVEKLDTNIADEVDKGKMINNPSLQDDETSKSKGTYVLLAVVGVALVCLIAFVAMKRRKRSNRNRNIDAEMPRGTELLDMDKKLLGKPIEKNGNSESAPLMGDKEKSDFAKPIKRNDSDNFKNNSNIKGDEPLLKSDNGVEEPNSRISNTPMQSFKPQQTPPSPKSANNNNNNNNNNAAENPDLNNKRPVPSPRKEIPAPVHDNTPPAAYGDNLPAKNNDDDVFLPAVISANARYSPVYSPDTGRVKIRLSETPKPKTPLLVTRSRSNAGDIVTTPNFSQRRTP